MRSAVSNLSAIALPSRYDLLFPLAAGGTASVHLGRLRGIAGFWRLVAVKVAHAHLEVDPSNREMMVEEARLASLIHHPNVVPVIDIDQTDGRLLLVMDYIEGSSLADVLNAGAEPMPAAIAVRIALDSCAGLHAAHSLSDATGRSLGLVHRDVSPQNILLGTDGVARLTDFGIAKTAFGKGRSGVGTLKGKLGYMAPEYIDGQPANASSDVFGLAVVVWEMITGQRLFRGENGHETLRNVMYAEAPLLSDVVRSVTRDLADVLAQALAKSPKDRFATAKAFGAALELVARRSDQIATQEQVAAYVMRVVGDRVNARRKRIADVFAAERPAHGGLKVVRPLAEDTASRFITPPSEIAVHESDSVSGFIPINPAMKRGYDGDDERVIDEESTPPSSVTKPSMSSEHLLGTHPSQSALVITGPATDAQDDYPVPVSKPSRDMTPRPSPASVRRAAAAQPAAIAAPAPVVQPAPAETKPAVVESSERITERPLRLRLTRDRTFQLVALAAFVFGALVRVFLSMGAPDAAADPLKAPPAVQLPAPAAH
ncbi:MAG: serine/threonine-protein kinase [Polyangiaceae bacterium]